jgi:hypothetical protein
MSIQGRWVAVVNARQIAPTFSASPEQLEEDVDQEKAAERVPAPLRATV